jgi:dienelactone hydrolase
MIRLPVETLDARAERLAPGFQILRPPEALVGPSGRVPAVVMLHGCGRPDGPQPAYAQAAAAAGIASIILDSYAARQINIVEAASLVCTGARLWGRERAGDLFAALHWARLQGWIDPDRLGALGWSHGGWTVMDALALTPQIERHAGLTDVGPTPLKGLRHVMAVYPWCGTGSHTTEHGWQAAVPFTVVIGGRDQVARPGPIFRAVARLQDDGVPVTVEHFPEATHSFDEHNSINPLTVQDPARRDEAVALFVREARQHLMV